MAKISLADFSSLQYDASATNNLNNNNAAIETAMENTLSRDGTSPNNMNAVLDMNSNRIINLPAPGGASDPVRLQDVTGSPTIALSITLAGDVTSPTGNGTLTTTIANNAVTNAKMADNSVDTAELVDGSVTAAKLATIADGTVLSNVSGGVATPSANTLTQVLDGTTSNTQGSILYRGASAWSALGPGTSGQVLSTNGAGANPSWVTGGGGGGTNLTPEDFGCVGNGTTDDTTNFQAFITACAGNTGVMTPGKTYILSNRILFPSNVTLYGYGSTVKAPVTGPTLSAQFHLTDATGGTLPGPNNCNIFGVTINGNAVARRAGGAFAGVGQYAGIYVYSCNYTHIKDCTVIDAEGDCFGIGGGFHVGSNLSQNALFENCFGSVAGRNIYSIFGGLFVDFVNCYGQNATYGHANGNISYGWDFEPDSAASSNAVCSAINCKAVGCTTTGIGFNNTLGTNSQMQVVSCYTQSCGVGYYTTPGTPQKIIGCRTLGNTVNYTNTTEVLASFP